MALKTTAQRKQPQRKYARQTLAKNMTVIQKPPLPLKQFMPTIEVMFPVVSNVGQGVKGEGKEEKQQEEEEDSDYDSGEEDAMWDEIRNKAPPVQSIHIPGSPYNKGPSEENNAPEASTKKKVWPLRSNQVLSLKRPASVGARASEGPPSPLPSMPAEAPTNKKKNLGRNQRRRKNQALNKETDENRLTPGDRVKLKGFWNQDKKALKTASKNLVVIKGYDIAEHARAIRRKQRVIFKPLSTVQTIATQEPFTGVDEKHRKLFLVYPNFFTPKTQELLLSHLDKWVKDNGSKIRSDHKDHGGPDSYVRNAQGPVGSCHLVTAWHPIGHPNIEAAPSTALAVHKTAGQMTSVHNLLADLKLQFRRINQVLKQWDLDAWRMLNNVSRMTKKIPGINAMAANWHSVMLGLALIFNRITPGHVDDRSIPEGYDILATLGDYKDGSLYLPKHGLTLPYGPRTLIILRGRLIEHEVMPWSGQRKVTLALFSNEAVRLQTGVPPACMSKVSVE